MCSVILWNCTGGGQGHIDSAARFGVDSITGEVSEQTIHSAREQGLHFMPPGAMPLNAAVFALANG